jgi:hypothetical protein
MSCINTSFLVCRKELAGSRSSRQGQEVAKEVEWRNALEDFEELRHIEIVRAGLSKEEQIESVAVHARDYGPFTSLVHHGTRSLQDQRMKILAIEPRSVTSGTGQGKVPVSLNT